MTTSPNIENINFAVLSEALVDSGWRRMGRSRGVVRFEDLYLGQRHWLLLPESQAVEGAQDLLDAAWRQLESLSPETRQRLETSLSLRQAPGLRDSLRFRKETSAPRGLIAWSEGEDLVKAAREMMSAGAKAYAGKKAYFGNSHSGFAQRYLSSCYMGQTGIGSYVVTALAPVTQLDVDLDAKSPYVDIQGRAITQALTAALEAAVESVEHYRATKSVEGFRAAVRRGFSVELARGLIDLAKRADEASIHVEFNADSRPLLGDNMPILFEFDGADVPALETAATTLAQPQAEALRQWVLGRVHLLSKAEAEGPGVVGIDTGAGKYRVRLSPDDYALALRAHEVEDYVKVEGIPSKEGNLVWLYEASFIEATSSPDPLF
ncbi:MAG: hypothetical protein QMB98_04570 [Flaviflexus sp.]|uniref:hypothetical protein n=1 Tax=Flaviflexus sp. TaxID=1969482 RepID=UPI00352F893D